ncbi:MAG: TonB-dependent receptor [Prevotellaceae bacterium]|jgi:iron complex outermembrane receptor protein|nr:TonB-dependent receptor [Prevotellaceae bacterium]
MKRKIFVSLLCLPCTIYAQSAAHDSVHNIEQVVVTANRTAVNRSSVPMTISVVSRDELEQSSESNILAGLSERIPGMFVTERGVTGFGLGAGGGGGITIRGVGGTPTGQVLMLVDGQPQFMGIMGHHLPDSYVSSDVDRVEVIRGPASILYGSNAMGGVVNIITRRQHADGWNAGGRLMYGAYNTQKYMGNAGFKAGKFDAFVSVNHDRTDGHRENSDFSITNAYARAGYRMTDHLNLWGDVMVAKNRSHNPGKVSVPITDHIADVLRGMASITLQNTFEKADGALKLFYNFGEHEINDGYGDGRQTTPRDYRFRSNDYNLGVSLYQALHLLEGNTITAGVDFMGYGGRARTAFLDGRPDAPIIDTSHHAAAGYVIMQQSLFDKLTLNAGVRYEHNALYGGEWVPQAGLAYTPWRTAVVKASVGKGFRSPSIRELYLWGAANPDLEPEHAWSYELAVEQRLFSNRLDLELAAYAIDGSNLIQVVPPSTGKNMNTGKFLNTGFEFSFRWQALRDLGLQGSYSYLHMDTPLLYSPEHQAFLAASYRFLSRWNFSLSGRLVDGLYSEIGANPATETFVTLDARVSFQPLRWRWISFFAKGENLANRTYQIITGYPMPGITVFGGVNVSLR